MVSLFQGSESMALATGASDVDEVGLWPRRKIDMKLAFGESEGQRMWLEWCAKGALEKKITYRNTNRLEQRRRSLL